MALTELDPALRFVEGHVLADELLDLIRPDLVEGDDSPPRVVEVMVLVGQLLAALPPKPKSASFL